MDWMLSMFLSSRSIRDFYSSYWLYRSVKVEKGNQARSILFSSALLKRSFSFEVKSTAWPTSPWHLCSLQTEPYSAARAQSNCTAQAQLLKCALNKLEYICTDHFSFPCLQASKHFIRHNGVIDLFSQRSVKIFNWVNAGSLGWYSRRSANYFFISNKFLLEQKAM